MIDDLWEWWGADTWGDDTWGEVAPPAFQPTWAANSNRTVGMTIQPE